VTEDDIRRVNAALEKTKGHREHAAIMIGMPLDRLNNIVIHKPELREKWGHHKRDLPEGAVGEIDRQPPEVKPFSREQLDAAAAIERQDGILQAGWGKLGINEKQRDFLIQLQATYATNLKGTLDLTYGGMVHAYTKLLFVFEDIIQKISDIDENPDKYRRTFSAGDNTNETKGPHEYRCELYDRLISIAGELRKTNEGATKANWVRAQLKRLESGQGDGKRKKAGWSAQPVQKVDDKQESSATTDVDTSEDTDG
jgi:hypothetical protein